MPLPSGTRIGPYEIVSPLGAGGMGEVYRARDTKLNREVALKVLPESLAADAGYLARFQHEAQALAALNHPNIAQIYGLEENTIVMELVEGADVSGPLPEDEALAIARQIADALAAAHEKGIVHRDLKPANIKVTPEGVVKVLDFGLAKTIESAAAGASHNSPTLTMDATQAGAILGTAAYMSPEQARGKPVDTRADIWAFGVVLYEILTGWQLFQGETISDILADVLKNEPLLSAVSPPMQRVLERCLRKDPKLRLRDIGDVWLALEEIPQPAPAPAPPQAKRSPWPWIAGLAAALALAPAAWFLKPKPDAPIIQTEITIPAGYRIAPIASSRLEFSPDGRSLVLPIVPPGGKPGLWLRNMETGSLAPLPGTEGAANFNWSPAGRWLAYIRGDALYKLDTMGGQPQRLANSNARGVLWTTDNAILLYGVPAILRIPVAGGSVEQAMPEGVPGKDAGGMRPVAGHRQFLYTAAGGPSGRSVAGISSYDGKSHQVLFEEDESPVTYAPDPTGGPGWLLYIHDGQLTAHPFDPARRAYTGDAIVIAEGAYAGPSFAHSGNGVLAFRRAAVPRSQLTWFTRDGKAAPAGDAGLFSQLRISPDGKRFAAARTVDGNQDIWLYPQTGGAETRLTFEAAADFGPVWTRDGRSIVYCSNRPGGSVVVERPVNGGSEHVLAQVEGTFFGGNFSPDGRWLIGIVARHGRSAPVLIPAGGGAPVPLPTDRRDSQVSFSPNGRWIVYQSDFTGATQVFVRPATDSGGVKWQITSSGGNMPHWRADGKEIFYIDPEGMLTAVPVEASQDTFHAGKPQALFRVRVDDGLGVYDAYDVAPNGPRFLVAQLVSESVETPITVIYNFPKLLTRSR
ncbi:MAG TPA: protein kinase [Bryobacteraceae bacterium]|nr:protein kinase [Bryobacteraceae bacterium]